MRKQKSPLINDKETWEVHAIKKLNKAHRCACGTKPLIELVVLEKIATREKLTIGKCCFQYFPGIKPTGIIEDIRKLSLDISHNVCTDTLTYALEKDILRDGERNFYLGILKKTNLPLAIKNRKKEINRKILSHALSTKAFS